MGALLHVKAPDQVEGECEGVLDADHPSSLRRVVALDAARAVVQLVELLFVFRHGFVGQFQPVLLLAYDRLRIHQCRREEGLIRGRNAVGHVSLRVARALEHGQNQPLLDVVEVSFGHAARKDDWCLREEHFGLGVELRGSIAGGIEEAPFGAGAGVENVLRCEGLGAASQVECDVIVPIVASRAVKSIVAFSLLESGSAHWMALCKQCVIA